MRTLNLFLLFFFLFALNSYSLPECTGEDSSAWDLCIGKQYGYVGEYKDGNIHGQGTFTFADGGKYIGEWKDGEKHGQGTMTYFDSGREVSGRWNYGKFIE